MLLAEERVPLPVGDAEYTMVFNFNTMAAFEGQSSIDAKKYGRPRTSYFDFILNLYKIYNGALEEAARKKLVEDPNWVRDENNTGLRLNVLQVLRDVSMIDLRALVWASLHTYDDRDDVAFPLTVSQVGKLIQKPLKMPDILNAVLHGHSENSPNEKELGKTSPVAKTKSAPRERPASKESASGGVPSLEFAEADFV